MMTMKTFLFLPSKFVLRVRLDWLRRSYDHQQLREDYKDLLVALPSESPANRPLTTDEVAYARSMPAVVPWLCRRQQVLECLALYQLSVRQSARWALLLTKCKPDLLQVRPFLPFLPRQGYLDTFPSHLLSSLRRRVLQQVCLRCRRKQVRAPHDQATRATASSHLRPVIRPLQQIIEHRLSRPCLLRPICLQFESMVHNSAGIEQRALI